MPTPSWFWSLCSLVSTFCCFGLLAIVPSLSYAAGSATPFVREAAARFCIPEAWIEAIIDYETEGKHGATSAKGAMSLMQLMPATWSDLRGQLSLGTDPYLPRDNILAGTAYLRELYDRFGAPDFLAAYNMGPQRFSRHVAEGRRLPRQTIKYLDALSPVVWKHSPAPCLQ